MIKFSVFCLKLSYWRIVFVFVCLFGTSSAFSEQTVWWYVENTTMTNHWPDSRYIVSTDRTVIDRHTGLMWTQCFYDFPNGGDCITTFISRYPEGHSKWDQYIPYPGGVYDWEEALNTAAKSTFAGYDDWRLPNVKELQSLVAYNRVNPAVNKNIFPNLFVPVEGGAESTLRTDFWTSSPAYVNDPPDNTPKAYVVNLQKGTNESKDRNYNTDRSDIGNNRILLVRLGDK